jgi:hypothetical protein
MQLLTTFALIGFALTGQAKPPAVTAPCVAPEYAQFDFWVGTWDVINPAGKPAGTNTITRTLDGCLVREEWTGAGGSRGASWNMFDRASSRWHQIWIDISGLVLHLRGSFTNGAMQMTDADDAGRRAAKGPINRITWTPRPDGTLRQLWETSADEGKSWKVAFDGTYRRASR